MMRAAAWAAALPMLVTAAQASSVCEGVERSANGARAALSLHDGKARALRSFAYDGWEIAEVSLSNGAHAFVFLSPEKPVAVWRGAWPLDEVSQSKEWTVENAPGIPNQLARCFAWHVARDRTL